MALYTERSYDDLLELERQERARQQAIADENYRRAKENADNASKKSQGGLAGILSGIGESIGNVGNSLFNMFGTGAASIRDLVSGNAESGKYTKEWDQYMKKQMGDENMSDKDYHMKTGGKALDAAAALSDFIPGLGAGARAAMNIGQGAASGLAQEYIDNGANADFTNALKRAGVGAAASGVGQSVAGKLAGRTAGNGRISKALNSNVGRSAISGATAGAVGGGLAAGLDGGDLSQVLSSAIQGAESGAIGGGAMAGLMGIAGAGMDKLNNKLTPQEARNVVNKLPETAISKQAVEVETPTQEQSLPATRQRALSAAQEETPLIQKGTPEYEAIKRQEYIDNRRRELRNTVTEGIRSQYGTIRLGNQIKGLDDAIMELAGYGLTKRSEIDGFSNRITGKDGEISKAIRKAMSESGKTNGRIDITMDDVYRASGASGNKSAMDKIESRFNSIGKKYTVDADGNMNRSDMYDFGRELEREGYRMIEYAGRSKDANGVDSAFGEAMRMLGENYIAKATDGVDMGKYINANKLKNLLPGNEAWAAHVDQSIPNIKTVSDARSFMASPTKLSLLADAVEYNKGTYGSNVGNLAKDGTQAVRAMTSGSPARAAVQYVAAKTLDSNAAKDRVVKNALKKYNNIEAGGTGKIGATTKLGGIGEKIRNIGKTLNNDTVNNSILGDILSRQTPRQIGLNQALAANARKEIQNAQSEMNNASAAYQKADDDYQQMMMQAASQQTSSGAQQLQVLSDAMDRALAAGDLTSYGKLADLYKEAYNIYGKKNEQTKTKSLTATQSKALTGLQQVEQLSQMTPDAGTALANSPLGFLVSMTGGNEYANQAQSLALTLGYLQSGANITPREAENIGKSYVPTAYDSEEIRQQKLARARQLLQNYLGDTSSLE